MHEDLLGYLLGALEPHEMRRIDVWLREDPEARVQLAEVERLLRPLEDDVRPIESPPPDLIARTMASLPPLPSPVKPEESQQADQLQQADDATAVHLAPMQVSLEVAQRYGWTWLDWAVASASAAAILALLLPAIAEGRFEARKTACQDQLRQLGTAITQFVTRSEQSRLPAVSGSGPEAFAGVYAVRLSDAGLMDDPTLRWCPSLDPPSQIPSPQHSSPTDQAIAERSARLVSIDDLYEASTERLKKIQQFAGGHYAYTLGVIDGDQLVPPRYESRSSFAVMSDAPLRGSMMQTDLAASIGHGGVGINVLYEDGRVQFVSVSSLGAIPDHPLMNNRGESEAGVNIDDASLAPSWRAPFLNVRQR